MPSHFECYRSIGLPRPRLSKIGRNARRGLPVQPDLSREACGKSRPRNALNFTYICGIGERAPNRFNPFFLFSALRPRRVSLGAALGYASARPRARAGEEQQRILFLMLASPHAPPAPALFTSFACLARKNRMRILLGGRSWQPGTEFTQAPTQERQLSRRGSTTLTHSAFLGRGDGDVLDARLAQRWPPRQTKPDGSSSAISHFFDISSTSNRPEYRPATKNPPSCVCDHDQVMGKEAAPVLRQSHVCRRFDCCPLCTYNIAPLGPLRFVCCSAPRRSRTRGETGCTCRSRRSPRRSPRRSTR